MCHEVALWEPAAVFPLRYAATKKALTVFFELEYPPDGIAVGRVEFYFVLFFAT